MQVVQYVVIVKGYNQYFEAARFDNPDDARSFENTLQEDGKVTDVLTDLEFEKLFEV